MAAYWAAGQSCDAAVQELMARWFILDADGETDAAAAVESVLNDDYGATMGS